METAGVYPLVRPRGVSALPPPRGAANPRAPQSATLRLISSEYLPPVRANPPAAVRVPRWVDAENPGNPEKIFPPEKAAKTPILTLRKRLSERYS